MPPSSEAQQKPFQSARLTYRAIELDDEAFVHQLESEPANHINSQLAIKKPQGKRDSKKHFDWLNECLLAVIISPTDGDYAGSPIGVVALTSLTADLAHHRHTELSLGFLPAHQGKGYGTEAIEWTLQWAFESAGLHRVSVKAFEYNPGAQRLYERMGFKHEGTIREMFWHNGRWWDDYEYGMLDKEWRARQNAR